MFHPSHLSESYFAFQPGTSELHDGNFQALTTDRPDRCRKTSKKQQKLLILLFLIRFVRPVIIPLGAIKSDTHLMPHPVGGRHVNNDESRCDNKTGRTAHRSLSSLSSSIRCGRPSLSSGQLVRQGQTLFTTGRCLLSY